jgi:regulator of protease activity HflC (stomatin/prohibitin superfamily)
VAVIKPGFYFKFPWQKVHTVSVATQTVSMAWDPEDPKANKQGQTLEAVTKDQLNTGLTGQIRFRVSEDNLYPYLFGVKNPYVHILGYFISVLRERIANFEAPLKDGGEQANPESGMFTQSVLSTQGVSINDLRKNLRVLNERMNQECSVAAERYGIVFEASLITGIDPPTEVESALAAINTAHNHVSSDISLAQASADQKIVQSRQAVEIQELKVQAEVQPFLAVAEELKILHKSGSGVLDAYVANRRLDLIEAAEHIITEWSNAK